jgi:integrase
MTTLPGAAKDPLSAHLQVVRQLHRRDLQEGAGTVALPNALAKKYPAASREWGWQWVFPATSRYLDTESHIQRRHHFHESVVQKAMKEAVRRCGIAKPATCHSLRHNSGTRIIPPTDRQGGLLLEDRAIADATMAA